MYNNKNERKPAAVIKNRNFSRRGHRQRVEDKKERNGTLQESMQGRISQKHKMAEANLQAHTHKSS